MGWCKDPDRGLPAPDKILFLDISVEDAMKVCLTLSAGGSVLCFVLLQTGCLRQGWTIVRLKSLLTGESCPESAVAH